MSITSNDKFIAQATDPASRATAIADIEKRAKRLGLISIIILLGFFGLCLFGDRQPDAAFILVVILPFMQLYRYESDLKLLRVIDELQCNDKPVA